MLKQVIVSLLCILLIHSQVSLGCEKPVTHLEKDAKAPCTGFLFSPEKEKEVRITTQEHELQKTEITLQKKKINLLLDNQEYWEEISRKEAVKAELWRIRAIDSTQKLVSSERNRETRDWLFLVGGVLLTIGSGFAVGQAAK